MFSIEGHIGHDLDAAQVEAKVPPMANERRGNVKALIVGRVPEKYWMAILIRPGDQIIKCGLLRRAPVRLEMDFPRAFDRQRRGHVYRDRLRLAGGEIEGVRAGGIDQGGGTGSLLDAARGTPWEASSIGTWRDSKPK